MSCHWSYRLGEYRSPWRWPTRASAERSGSGLATLLGIAERLGEADSSHLGDLDVFQVHWAGCNCSDPWKMPPIEEP